MTPRDLRNIHTSLCDMALKLSQYFYLLMEKPSCCYFHVWSPKYQVAHGNQKTPIPVSSRWQVRSGKAKKGWVPTLITANTSVHLPTPVSTDLTIKSDLVLTNPIGIKHLHVIKHVIKHLPNKAFLWSYHH